MKKFLVSFFLIISVLTIANISAATLIDNMDGTVTQIRDDGSQLIWLKDANSALTTNYVNQVSLNREDGLMNWWEANDYINYLNSICYLNYDDWRLPDVLPVNGVSYNYDFRVDGTADRGYNITSPNSELGYMFYVELGNAGYYDTEWNHVHPYGFLNTGPFTNVTTQFGYYLRRDYAPDQTEYAWVFLWGGLQDFNDKVEYDFVWAVSDGHRVSVPAPEPTTLLLLGPGLAGLAAFRRKLKKT